MRTAGICVIALVFACPTAMAETPEQIFKQVSPSVVVIRVSDAAGKPLALGSGVVIHRGTVITNCHLAQAGARLVVNYRGKSFVATLRYADTDRDLCELSVPDLPAPPVALANTGSLQVGQSVYAIGAPEGLELTLSAGLVSALRSVAGLRYIQTTAPISPGSSGGGLFDEQGRLVGITTFYLKKGENLNFALPADWIAGLPERASREAAIAASAQARGRASLLAAAERLETRAQREVSWLSRADAAEKKSDWQALLKISLAWVRQEPRSASAYEGLGEAYTGLQQYGKALEADQEAVRLDPEDAEAWTDLGVDYSDLQQHDKALAADQEAVRLAPKVGGLWLELGVDYRNLQQYDKALAAHQEAARLDPQSANTWTDLAVDYSDLQQYDSALAADQEAARLDPENTDEWHNLGVDYRDLRQYDRALAADQEAVRLDPKNAAAWHGLGADYTQLNQYDKALTADQEAVRLDPKFPAAWLDLGMDYCSHG